MEKTMEGSLTIRDFKGLDNSTDELKQSLETVTWMHGLYPNDVGRLERLKGKLPHPNSTGHGSVLSISQLTFSRKSAVLTRCSSYLFVTTIMEAMIDEPTVASPMDPFIPLTGEQ